MACSEATLAVALGLVRGGSMTKVCSKCKIAKELTAFSPDPRYKYCVGSWCKLCHSVRMKKRYQEDLGYRIRNNKASKTRYAKVKTNPEFKEENSKRACEWAKKNIEKHRKHGKNYRIWYPDRKLASTRKYQADKLQRTPRWLSPNQLQEIQDVYTAREMLQLATGEQLHVDHIVPLQGKNVSGLHVPWNLRITTATENLSKGNRLDVIAP
jgi:hypothetical protein